MSQKQQKNATKTASKVTKSAPKRTYTKKVQEPTGTEYDLETIVDTPLQMETFKLDNSSRRKLYRGLAWNAVKSYFKTFVGK